MWLMFQWILIGIYLLYVAHNRKGHKFLLNIVLAALRLTFKASKNGSGEGMLALKKLLGKEKGSYIPKNLERNPLWR